MSLLCDYFLAASDELAVKTLDWVGGPAKPQEGTGLPTVSMPGIEPTVMMSTLQELLTGHSAFELIAEDAHPIIASRDDGELLVIVLADALQQRLASASPAELHEVAVPWSETEEFWGQGDPDELAPELVALADLARRGVETGQRLYCWVCV